MNYLDEPLDNLVAAAQSWIDIRRELENLRGIKAWALEQLPFREGDEVVIVRVKIENKVNNGWWPHREHLVPGATGIAESIEFSTISKVWVVMYKSDVEWTVSDYDEKRKIYIRNPNDKHLFMFHPEFLRKRQSDDRPLIVPDM